MAMSTLIGLRRGYKYSYPKRITLVAKSHDPISILTYI